MSVCEACQITVSLSFSVGRAEGRRDPQIPNPNRSWWRAIRQTGSPIRTELNRSRGVEDERRGEREVCGKEMSQFYKDLHRDGDGPALLCLCVYVSAHTSACTRACECLKPDFHIGLLASFFSHLSLTFRAILKMQKLPRRSKRHRHKDRKKKKQKKIPPFGSPTIQA